MPWKAHTTTIDGHRISPTEAGWTITTERGPLGLALDRAPQLLAAPFRGLWLILRGAFLFVIDYEGRQQRQGLTAPEQAAQRIAVQRQHRADQITRLKWVGGGLGALALALLVVLPRSNDLQRAILATGVFAALCIIGRARADEQSPTPRATDAPGLAYEHADAALAASLAKVQPGTTRVIAPARAIHHGHAIDLELPPGVPAGAAIAERPAVASALRIPVDALVLERGSRHEGHLRITALDRPLRDLPPAPHPFADAPRVDVFDGLPAGTTPTGTPVRIPVVGSSAVVGAIPGGGKSYFLRHLLTGCALDPRVEIHVHAFKVSRDFDPLRLVATSYRVGSSDDDMAHLVALLRRVRADVDRRGHTLTSLTDDQAPDAKPTTSLADDPALRLHPVVVVLDETSVAFAHPDHGAEAAKLVEQIVRLGRSVGIGVWLADQKPSERSMPTDLRDNVDVRVAFATETQAANDIVLGTGAHKSGATTVPLTRADAGIGIIRAETIDRWALVRTHGADLPTTRRIVEQAAERRALMGGRTVADTLDLPAVTSFADRLLDAWPMKPSGEPFVGLALADIAERFGLSVSEVRGLAAAEGIPLDRVKVRIPGQKEPSTRQGIRLKHLTPADDVADVA